MRVIIEAEVGQSFTDPPLIERVQDEDTMIAIEDWLALVFHEDTFVRAIYVNAKALEGKAERTPRLSSRP